MAFESLSLRERLDTGPPLIADGATGTRLQAVGLSCGEAPERWTLDRPEAIRQLAADYIAAGSDVVYTNTFGGNRIRLRLSGLEEQMEEINRCAVRLAREAMAAAGRPVYLVASIGPTGEMLEPYGDLEPQEAAAAFREQAEILLKEGVDGFACETFGALEEAVLCLEAVRAVAGDLPVFVSMAFETSGRTMMGVTPEAAVQALSAAGADVVGANCSVGPEVVEAALRAMHAAFPGTRLLAKPNAGLPRVEDGRTVYPVGPDAFAAFAGRVAPLNTRVLGGCCGSAPEHIRALKGSF